MRQPPCGEQLQRLLKEGAFVRRSGQGHDPAQFDTRQGICQGGQIGADFRGFGTRPTAYIQFDHNPNFDARFRCGFRESTDCVLRIGGNGQFRAFRECHQPAQLLLADDVERDQYILVATTIHHDLGLAEFLAGNTDRSTGHLHVSNGQALVGLDMRPQANSVLVEIGLVAIEVVLHAIEVNHQMRGIEIVHIH